MSLLPRIKELSREYFSDVVSIRQHLHEHPELSFSEFETSKFISACLSGMGISFKEGIGGTGIVAIIEGLKNSGPSSGSHGTSGVKAKTVALRADMDALPIIEKNDIPYKSKNAGVMHACGHDAHSASLLGTARILNELKSEFSGTVKLIFQPGEEKFPGGASLLIKEGVLENPSPASIFAQHVAPEIPVGKIGFRSGMYMASADEIYVTVKGKGGHAAFPKLTVNPLLMASKILVTLDEEFKKSPLLGRGVGGEVPTVLSFGKIIANGATNIIPDEVNMEGTFRTMNEKWRAEAHLKMTEIAQSIAKEMGGSCDFRILKGYPVLINDANSTSRAKKYAEEFIGKENIVELEQRMGSEDFAWYAQVIPACFYRVGVGNTSKGISSGLHTPGFNIDETALETSMGLMAWIAFKELNDLSL